LHPLESAAFSRRTPKADIPLAHAGLGRDFEDGDHSLRLTLDYADQGHAPDDTPVSKTVSDPDFIRDAKGRCG
jgi:hypothetical protein